MIELLGLAALIVVPLALVAWSALAGEATSDRARAREQFDALGLSEASIWSGVAVQVQGNELHISAAGRMAHPGRAVSPRDPSAVVDALAEMVSLDARLADAWRGDGIWLRLLAARELPATLRHEVLLRVARLASSSATHREAWTAAMRGPEVNDALAVLADHDLPALREELLAVAAEIVDKRWTPSADLVDAVARQAIPGDEALLHGLLRYRSEPGRTLVALERIGTRVSVGALPKLATRWSTEHRRAAHATAAAIATRLGLDDGGALTLARDAGALTMTTEPRGELTIPEAADGRET